MSVLLLILLVHPVQHLADALSVLFGVGLAISCLVRLLVPLPFYFLSAC